MAPRRVGEPVTSWRHPQLSLRDNIATKMLALFGPEEVTVEILELAREIVDDLADYAREPNAAA